MPVPVNTSARIDWSLSMRVKVSRSTARSSGSSRLCSRGRLSRTSAWPPATLTSGVVDWPSVSALSGNGISRRFCASANLYGLGAYFNSREEEGDLVGGILERVRPVHRIRFDRLGEILADRPWRGVRRIGCAHDFPVERHRTLSFEHLHDDRTRGHECHEISIKRPLGMHLVEALCL